MKVRKFSSLTDVNECFEASSQVRTAAPSGDFTGLLTHCIRPSEPSAVTHADLEETDSHSGTDLFVLTLRHSYIPRLAHPLYLSAGNASV